VVSFRITKGNIHDTKKFSPLVRGAAEKYDIKKLHADKAYDNKRRNYNLLDEFDVELAIEIRNNASTGQEDMSVKKGRSITNQQIRISRRETA
jgi:hypothetical protein